MRNGKHAPVTARAVCKLRYTVNRDAIGKEISRPTLKLVLCYILCRTLEPDPDFRETSDEEEILSAIVTGFFHLLCGMKSRIIVARDPLITTVYQV